MGQAKKVWAPQYVSKMHLKPFGIVDVGVRQFLTLLDENGWIIFRNKVQELVIFLLVQYR